ncbi:phosphatase 1 regulatory subunit 27 [Brachionus plicatilis]|uniref:Phosphatase 1 regulatory subunit 27 n=1 Tax=Brachionus plicatilis TaxID=10195 RepID=A0A3M7RYQ3_BRAPC|nr:phosphatase 1 regulatory subunit 27 [Brachionus plicatilis]
MAQIMTSLSVNKNSDSVKDFNLEDSTSTGSSLSLAYSTRSSSQTSFSDDDEQLSPAYSELLKAITSGNLGMVKQMLDYGLDVNFIYDKEQNYSFLHLACLMGHSKVIKYLLDCGANANFVTSDGHQAIDFIQPDDLNTISYMLVKMRSILVCCECEMNLNFTCLFISFQPNGQSRVGLESELKNAVFSPALADLAMKANFIYPISLK